MERLTRRHSDGSVGISQFRYYNYDDCQKMMQKLAAYEDAEEQGLLLRLPCKIGTEIYELKRCITYGEVGDKPEYYYWISSEVFCLNMVGYFGKTIFLTKAEAEKALAKL